MPRRKKKTARRKGVRRGPQGATTWSATTAGLKSYRSQLAYDRDTLDEKIGAIDTALEALGLGGPASGGTRTRGGRAAAPRTPTGRAARAGSLKQYIMKVLSRTKADMAVKDIASNVRKAGYKTRNQTFAKSVGIALADMPNVSKVGRGRYKLK